jgi:hypothetical protein
MCKVGILLIGLDLYHSASTLFHSLLLHHVGSPLDLFVHIIALITLLLAYRGRVKRSIAGKVVLPVMMVNAVKGMLAGQFISFETTTTTTTTSSTPSSIAAGGSDEKMNLTWSFFDNANTTDYERLMVIKSLLFCGVMARLAFQGDDSCVGENEWFPWQRPGVCGGVDEGEGVVDEGKKME